MLHFLEKSTRQSEYQTLQCFVVNYAGSRVCICSKAVIQKMLGLITVKPNKNSNKQLRLHPLEIYLEGSGHTKVPSCLSDKISRCHFTFSAHDVFVVACFLACDALTEVTVVYQNGLPVISVSLPSRRERCQFTLKPLSDCVGVFLQQLQAEDRGIDRVAIYSTGKKNTSHNTAVSIYPSRLYICMSDTL